MRTRRRTGFTLIELAVVIAVLGVLATAAVLKLTPLLVSGRVEDAAGQVAQADRLTRQAARRLGTPLTLAFDRGRGEIVRTSRDANSQGAGQRTTLARMPRGCRIERVLVHGARGAEEVGISADGIGPTYAVLVRGGGGKGVWLLVAGLTGRAIPLDNGADDEPDLQALLDPPVGPGLSGFSVEPPGDDAP